MFWQSRCAFTGVTQGGHCAKGDLACLYIRMLVLVLPTLNKGLELTLMIANENGAYLARFGHSVF